MITHLERDIPECEIKWALGSIDTNKASGGDGIPVELFQTRKGDAVKVLQKTEEARAEYRDQLGGCYAYRVVAGQILRRGIVF